MTQQETIDPADNADTTDHVVHEYRFQFTGSGKEYFSIWIVNLLLSVLTLGIYSAWAKVRREQYFHRNTLLDDQPFDYTGNPRSILIGRILALAIISAGSTLQNINIGLALGVTLAFALLYPWAVVRSAKFRARNTRYRNIAFHFTGTTKESVKVYLWLYVVILPMTLFSVYFFPELQQLSAQGANQDQALAQKIGFGVLAAMAVSLLLFVGLWPVYLCRIRSFLHRNLRYGNAQGSFDGAPGAFYRAMMRVSGATVVALVIAIIITAVVVMVAAMLEWQGASMLFPLLYLPFLISAAAYTTNVTNATYRFASIGGQRFTADMKTGSYARLLFTNLLAMIFTIGLAWPWVKVQLVRYKLEHLAINATPASFDGIIGEAQQGQSAFGEEVADFLDFDISL